MAKMEHGPLISAISGSVGGITFNRGPAGTRIYNRPIHKRPPSPAQSLQRSFIAGAAHAWGALDPDITQAWNTLARQEQIPTFFSRGRRWTGRQLFYSFFIAAEHQYTPLPARWLPTPPLFFECNYIDCFYCWPQWNPGDPLDDPPILPYWEQYTFVRAQYPDILNPTEESGLSQDGINVFWAAFLPKNRPPIPRNWFKIAPLPPSFGVWTNYGITSNSGFEYLYWKPFFDSTLGVMPGFVQSATEPGPAPYNIAWRWQSLTDLRLYYCRPILGTPHYSWSAPEYNDDDIIPIPSVFWFPGQVNPYYPPPLASRNSANSTYPKTEY